MFRHISRQSHTRLVRQYSALHSFASMHSLKLGLRRHSHICTHKLSIALVAQQRHISRLLSSQQSRIPVRFHDALCLGLTATLCHIRTNSDAHHRTHHLRISESHLRCIVFICSLSVSFSHPFTALCPRVRCSYKPLRSGLRLSAFIRHPVFARVMHMMNRMDSLPALYTNLILGPLSLHVLVK